MQVSTLRLDLHRRQETNELENLLALCGTWERNSKSLGHPPQNSRINIVWAIGRSEDHDSVRARQEAIP